MERSLNLHGRRSIWASCCKALELECRDEDFQKKKKKKKKNNMSFFRNLKNLSDWNTNGIMVWAWMLWSSYALGTRTEVWFGHGGSGHRMLSQKTILWRTPVGRAKVIENPRPNMRRGPTSRRKYGYVPSEPGHLAHPEPNSQYPF